MRDKVIPLEDVQFVPCHCQVLGELVHMHFPKHTPLHAKPWHSPESREEEPSLYLHLLSFSPWLGYTMQPRYTISRVLRMSRIPQQSRGRRTILSHCHFLFQFLEFLGCFSFSLPSQLHINHLFPALFRYLFSRPLLVSDPCNLACDTCLNL